MANKSNDAAELLANQAGRIHARIIDYKYGLQEIDNVCAVRVVSRNYRLLIMEDYLPALGQVEGDVIVVKRDEELSFTRVRGFYKVQHNEFVLLIDGDLSEEAAEEEAESV